MQRGQKLRYSQAFVAFLGAVSDRDQFIQQANEVMAMTEYERGKYIGAGGQLLDRQVAICSMRRL